MKNSIMQIASHTIPSIESRKGPSEALGQRQGPRTPSRPYEFKEYPTEGFGDIFPALDQPAQPRNT